MGKCSGSFLVSGGASTEITTPRIKELRYEALLAQYVNQGQKIRLTLPGSDGRKDFVVAAVTAIDYMNAVKGAPGDSAISPVGSHGYHVMIQPE